jgi:tripartite-type tricarboxylate transporter receptor subunit TctC
MTRLFLARLAGSALALSLAWAGTAQAETVEEFYKNNPVTFVVSAEPAGGTDFFARLFAPYFVKHIPGKPRLIIQNVAGASGMTAALQLLNPRNNDGTVVTLLQRNNLYLPLVSEKNRAFDPRKVRWIGSLNKEHFNLIAMSDAPVKKAADLFTTKVRLGATSFANENRTIPAMLNEYFGTKIEIVTGYSGNDTIHLALDRGEIQARMQSASILDVGIEAQWYKEGRVKVILQTAMKPHPAFAGVPNIFDFTKDPEVIALATFMLSPFEAGRPIATSPGVPEDRLKALRKAFDEAMVDPEFLAALKKVNGVADPISGEQVEEIIAGLYATPPSVLEKVRKLLTPK